MTYKILLFIIQQVLCNVCIRFHLIKIRVRRMYANSSLEALFNRR